MPSSQVDLLMASLGADRTDVSIYFGVLADKLQGALGTSVELRAPRRRRRGAPERELVVRLGDHEMHAALQDGTVTCLDRVVVRGVAIQSTPLGFDEWLVVLVDVLSTEARRSEATRLAMERLLA